MTATLEELEKRLRVLEDIDEIKQLHTRYLNAFGAGESGRNEIIGLFAENATVDIRPCLTENDPDNIRQAGAWPLSKGKAEITKLYKGEFRTEPIGPPKQTVDARFVVHPLVTVEGDKATGKWIYYHLHSHPRTLQMLFWIQATYDCEFVRENGKWKYSYLKWRCGVGRELGAPPYE